MTTFTIHTEQTAPAASSSSLAESKAMFGMIPNMHAVMAESPELLEAYKATNQLFTNSTLDNDEKTVVWQTINVENNCTYCVPAHTGLAHHMGVDNAITEALRNGTALPTEKLEVLRTFTLNLVRERGHVGAETLKAFLNAGFTKRNVLEVVLGYSQKVMSNYTNHLANTPLDKALEPMQWQKSDLAA